MFLIEVALLTVNSNAAKDFEDVHVLKAPLLGRCLIEGLHPDNVTSLEA